MKVLHYTLGLPPYRTGGLTKYSIDLMQEEAKQGHNVILLYPGKIGLLNHNTRICKNRNFGKLKVYELINPLPVPLLYGIKDIETYTRECNIDIFYKFLKDINVDCIHIHTLMGLPKEFLIVAKELKIKTIFTSHDYFGLCPKCSLYNTNNKICEGYNDEKCSICSSNAISYKKNIVLQSHLYKRIKNWKLIKNLRNKKKNEINSLEKEIDNKQVYNYKKLKEYYYSMFSYIDIFHFNSKTSYEVFSKFIKINNYEIIPITHANIKDNRKKHNVGDNEIVRLGYLGAQTVEKGFFELIQVLDKINNNKIKLSIYFKPKFERKYIEIHDKYNYNKIAEVFEYNDIIVVPSLWKETFGLVVLEALSHGTPVIVSENVGAKDLVKNNITGFIFEDEKKLLEIIENIDKRKIEELSNNILEDETLSFNMNEHTEKILKLYQGESNE